MKKTIYSILLLFSLNFFGQELTIDWIKNTVSSSSTSLAIDNENNIISVGYIRVKYYLDNFIEKRDESGNIIWSKRLDDTSDIEVKVDKNNQIYIYGKFSWDVDFDPGPDTNIVNGSWGSLFILKLDKDGNFIWVKTITGSNINKGNLFIRSDDIFLTGSGKIHSNFDSTQELIYSGNFFLKLDSDGEYINHFKINDSETKSLAVDSNDDVYTANNYNFCITYPDESQKCDFQVTVTKYSSNDKGKKIWRKHLGNSGDYSGQDDYTLNNGMILTKDEDIVITGYGNIKNFTAKIGKDGNLIWHYEDNFINGFVDITKTVLEDQEGNIFTFGEYIDSEWYGDHTNFFIRKNDSEGNLKWKFISGIEFDKSTGATVSAIIDKKDNIIFNGLALSDVDLDPSSKDYTSDINLRFMIKYKKDYLLGINKFFTKNKINLYPNPSNGIFYINSNTINKIKTISIYNTKGKLIYTYKNPQLFIDLSKFSNGIYIAEINTQDQISYSKILKR